MSARQLVLPAPDGDHGLVDEGVQVVGGQGWLYDAALGRELAAYLSGGDLEALALRCEALLAIVEREGPILGERLQSAYVRAAGGQRVTRVSASAINKVITAAVRRGLLVQDNPLHDPGIQPCTYRLPNQPRLVLRTLGPRILDEVPDVSITRHGESVP